MDEILQLTDATKEIHAWIEKNLKDKRVDDRDVLRASSASQCVKKRWFKHKGYRGEELQPRAIMVFALGDAVEHIYKYFIENACVGPGKLYSEVDFGKKLGTFTIQHREFTTYEQETIKVVVSNLEISGHCDGWGKRSCDGEWELIEIKSAASFGYDKFVNGETPDYIKQVHAYLLSEKAKALGAKSVRFFYLNKNTSHIYDRLYDFDSAIAQQVVSDFIASVKDEEPNRPYEPIDETERRALTGRKILGYPCSYCEYKIECYKGSKLEFSKSGKPVWVVE